MPSGKKNMVRKSLFAQQCNSRFISNANNTYVAKPATADQQYHWVLGFIKISLSRSLRDGIAGRSVRETIARVLGLPERIFRAATLILDPALFVLNFATFILSLTPLILDMTPHLFSFALILSGHW